MLPLLTDTSREVDRGGGLSRYLLTLSNAFCQPPFLVSIFSERRGILSFLSSLKIGSQMGVSWAMNLLMYCSLPQKARISFFLCLWYRHVDNCFGFCRSTSISLLLTMNPSSLPDKAPNLLPAFFRMKTKTLFPQSVKHFLQIHGLLKPRSCHRHRPPFPCESYHERAQLWLAGTSPRHSLDQTASPCNRTRPPI